MIEANCYVGTRVLPTLPNVARNIAELALSLLGIGLAKRRKLKIPKMPQELVSHPGIYKLG